jgi:hypothetical protein
MSKAVIDQPGLRVLFFGLLISFVLGFTLRTQISSSRVEKTLQKAVKVLEKDFSIDFENAEMRLAKWGFPWPHLVIEKIRISPKKSVCQSSQIYIDELELPLSLKQILSSSQVIDFVRAQNVEIRLNEIDKCFNTQNKKSVLLSESEKIVQSQANQIFNQSNHWATRSALNEIAIEQLKIISVKNIEQPVVLKQLKFSLKYDQSQLVQIDFKSRLYSFKDQRTNIYFLNADLSAQINPDLDQNIEATLQLKGKMLDGDLQIFSKLSSLSQKMSYEMSLKSVSLKAFSPIMNQTQNEFPLDKWPLAISFYMLGETQKNGELKSFFKFKDISVFGENTSLESTGLDIELAHEKTFVKPFQMNLKQMDLSPLKKTLSEYFDFRSIENLGFITGLFKFEDSTHWSFVGPIEKTELIFSNRGSRELQTIDSINMNLDRNSQTFNLKLNDFVSNGQEITGGLEGQYLHDQKAIQIKLNLRGVLIGEKIWKQLTLINQAPVVKLSWNYRKSQEERHEAKLILNELQFLGLHINDVQVDFLQLKENQSQTLGLNLKANKVQIHVPEFYPRFSKIFFNSETELTATDYVAMKTQMNLQGSDWKNINFDLDSSLHETEETPSVGHIKLKGDWKSDNTLAGLLWLQGQKRIQKFNLVKTLKDEIDMTPLIETKE